VISLRSRKSTPAAQVMSNRMIVLGTVILLGIAVAAFTLLLWRYGGLDAIRTATAIAVGAGITARTWCTTSRLPDCIQNAAQRGLGSTGVGRRTAPVTPPVQF
jgi:hypothetical protein